MMGVVMAKGDDIDARMIQLAIDVVNLCSQLPKNYVGQHFAKQLLRSGTSPAANYAEARSAESPRDFVHKLKICLKELNERAVWLKIIKGSRLLPDNAVNSIQQESLELSRIINASISTAKSRQPNR